MTTCYTPSATAPETQARKPRYTIQGSTEAYVLNVELPGVPKDSLTINYDADVLTIQGQRKATQPESWKPLHRELNDLGYLLRLKLNAAVDIDKLSAQLADGVLTLQLPLQAAAKPRRIEVN